MQGHELAKLIGDIAAKTTENGPKFQGPLWGEFRTGPCCSQGKVHIACTPTNGQPWFLITVERWLDERKAGHINAA
jgi:hypothetical protein